MARPSTFTKEELYHVYYSVNEAPEHLKKSTYQLAKEDPKGRDQSTFSRAVTKAVQLLADPKEKEAYEAWKSEILTPKSLFSINDEKAREGILEITSPYSDIVAWAKRRHAKAKDKVKAIVNIRARLNLAQKAWLMLGKKAPTTWTENDFNEVITKVGEGSKFSIAVAMRTVAPQLKRIAGLTEGLKPSARKYPIIATKEFPSLLQKIISTAKDLAETEREKDEIELIILTKVSTGMRTGQRRFNMGLWGTRIATPPSSLQIVNNDFTWEVLEKRDEMWSINFKPEPFRSKLLAFVRKYGHKIGEYLIEMDRKRANALLKKACELNNVTPLNLHALRKAYISFLVRSGFPLEKAIRINVGWTDIATAYKHYLEFEMLAEDIEAKKHRFQQLLYT